jgi:hypothetical protein
MTEFSSYSGTDRGVDCAGWQDGNACTKCRLRRILGDAYTGDYGLAGPSVLFHGAGSDCRVGMKWGDPW